MHFYLKVEGTGAWVLFYLFLLLLYFVNVLLVFLTFEGGRRHGSFFTFFKKKILKGVGRGFFFLHFLLLFYYLEVFFVTFCLFWKGKVGHEFFLSFFLFLNLGSGCGFYFFTFFYFVNS